jgi:hypothetical protein
MGISTFGQRAGPFILPRQEPLREIEPLLHFVQLMTQIFDFALEILQLAIAGAVPRTNALADGPAQRPAQHKDRRERHEQNDYGEFRTV